MPTSRQCVAVVVMALVLATSLACEMLGGFKEYRLRVDAVAGGGSAGQTSVEFPPGLHGPAMARIRARDGSHFWIDTTEVTVGQYAEFLQNAPSVQDGLCDWNQANFDAGTAAPEAPLVVTPGFQPPEDCASEANIDLLAGTNDEAHHRPMTCVDWCDAAAYCKWAEKSLCDDDESADAKVTTSEWVTSCIGSERDNDYGLDVEWKLGLCNGGSLSHKTLQPVGASANCSVSHNGQPVFDLSGNAAEWVAACNSNTSDRSCVSRGGSYASSQEALRCAALERLSREKTLATLGFRCCASVSGASNG